MLTSADKKSFALGLVFALLVLGSWTAAFLYTPVDANQGEVYRIIYLHVPSALAAFLSAFVLLLLSIWALKSKSESALRWSKACAEVGLLFTIITLMTGSIWGKPTWGTWWTWDARLTTTFLLALLYAGYLLLYASMSPGPGRIKVCAALGIVICANVPIIYKSVTWWRTLHQPPSMIREGGSTMDPEILYTILICIGILCAYGFWLGIQRARNLALRDEVEQASFSQIRGA